MSDVSAETRRWMRQSDMFQAEEGSNTFEAYFMGDGQLHVAVDNPWAGSTETGFGATTYFNLSPEDATKLISWATKWLFETQQKAKEPDTN
jgi:hypothetical protein